MKKTIPQKLSKRLVQYGALSLAIAGVADASGQIIYTDVNPDSDGTNIADQFIEFDLDNDGSNEFRIKHQNLFNKLEITPLLGGSVLGNFMGGVSDNYKYPFALNQDAIISSLKTDWINNYFQTLNVSSCFYSSPSGDYNNWCNVTDKYLGLRFLIGANTHYGWARLDVSKTLSYPASWWILKDYAYNSTPDAPINAGQQTLGLDDNIFSNVKIVALNKSIALFNLPQQTNYRLFSLTGQSVLDGKITNNTYVIEANTLASGIYIIELKDNTTNAVIRKKIVL